VLVCFTAETSSDVLSLQVPSISNGLGSRVTVSELPTVFKREWPKADQVGDVQWLASVDPASHRPVNPGPHPLLRVLWPAWTPS